MKALSHAFGRRRCSGMGELWNLWKQVGLTRMVRSCFACEYGTSGMYWKASSKGLTMKESSKVNGPWTKSKRIDPVLMMIKRGFVDLAGFMTVAARALLSKLKILPELMNGAQLWHHV